MNSTDALGQLHHHPLDLGISGTSVREAPVFFATDLDPTPIFDRLLLTRSDDQREVVRRLMGAEVAR